MTKDETARILLRLNEAFHRVSGPGELAVWAEQIRRCDYAVALEATQLLVRTQDRFPTVNRFVDTVQALLRRRSLERRSTELALPLPFAGEDVVRSGIARAREALAAVRGDR